MKFNLEKCHIIPVTRKKTVIKTQYMLHEQILETVSQVKYLGITIASGLRWNAHINNISLKANRSPGFLRRNLKASSIQIKTQAYFSFVRPILENSCTVWDLLHLYTDKPTRNDPTPCSSICATSPPQYFKCNRYAPDIRMEIPIRSKK